MNVSPCFQFLTVFFPTWNTYPPAQVQKGRWWKKGLNKELIESIWSWELEMKNEATVMVSGESVSLCTSTLMFVLSSSPSSLTLHVALYDVNSPNFVSWSLGPSTHHRPALCPVRTDSKRADLVGNWLGNELAGLGVDVNLRTGCTEVF